MQNILTFQIVSGIIKGFKDGDWSLFLDGLKTLFTGFINDRQLIYSQNVIFYKFQIIE